MLLDVLKQTNPNWLYLIAIINVLHVESCIIVLEQGKNVNFPSQASRLNVSYVLTDIK